jgi:hypothetical protein
MRPVDDILFPSDVQCGRCRGRGEVKAWHGAFQQDLVAGTRMTKIEIETCPTCAGTGRDMIPWREHKDLWGKPAFQRWRGPTGDWS